MSLVDMKRTQSCSFLDINPLSKKIDSAHGDLVEDVSCDSLTASVIVSDDNDACETESLSSSSLVSSTDTLTDSEGPRNHVSFNDSVAVRVVYCNSDDEESEKEEERIDDSVIELKEEDNSTPFIEPVKFDPAEEAIRSQLVGCICATRRKKHDFARMYGCGKSIGSDDCDEDSASEDEDNDTAIKEPVRVIVACDASSAWFSFGK